MCKVAFSIWKMSLEHIPAFNGGNFRPKETDCLKLDTTELQKSFEKELEIKFFSKIKLTASEKGWKINRKLPFTNITASHAYRGQR